MPLVNSLLNAIIQADGDALVLHVGERPYIVAPSGQSEVASRVLTLETMTGLLVQLLPDAARRVLDEFGAVQQDLPADSLPPDQRLTVVAARGGNDIWIEIRRHRKLTDMKVTAPPVRSASVVEPEPAPSPTGRRASRSRG